MSDKVWHLQYIKKKRKENPQSWNFFLPIKMYICSFSAWRWKGRISADLSQQLYTFIYLTGGMATGPVIEPKSSHLQENGRVKEATQMCPIKRTEWINNRREANLLTMSLKYKLQEARTFWWTSNSLPWTIIFRSVNSFTRRCWFNSFNISVEQKKKHK